MKRCNTCGKILQRKKYSDKSLSKGWAWERPSHFYKRKFCSNECSVKNPERKEKIRATLKRKNISPKDKFKFKKGHIPWTKGKKLPPLSEEHKKKIAKGVSKVLKGKPKLKNRGKNHWNWQEGKTSKEERVRKSLKYNQWRKKVYERDDYTCWICNKRGGKIHAHHLRKFSDYPELRLIANNGLTLCKLCHKIYTKFITKTALMKKRAKE
ncbi:MAG: hypothetical protein PHW73_02325 [Atribacterota bacterium]|nr:hypothetical protein [Atribacterota bacterium]